ncbi:MAG: type II toxin-antitoxin system HipA family toxin [Rhodocyclaceae bacterium]|nr:type II toxin-antitoxin system HipA family toxin [Rhodocyclaceae bacterium]
MKELDVFYEGRGERWKLGTLADDRRNVLFEYSQEALNRKLELSPLRCPLRTEVYPDRQDQFVSMMRLPGLLYDALPDGWGLRLMDRKVRSRGIDPATLTGLDRLAYLGQRTLGALTFFPATQELSVTHDMTLLELAGEVQALLLDSDREVLDELAYVGASPGGARPKALVFFNPKAHQMSTREESLVEAEPWLVKFPSEDDETDSCALEELYARMARHSQLGMGATQFFQLSGKLTAFGARRFDREAGKRVHIHSLAGLLHLNFRIPSIGYGDFLRATRRLTRDMQETHQALQRCIFNVLMNNRDDHTKNIAYLLDSHNEWKLAPPFDLTYCAGYNGEHFMDMAGEGRHPARSHILAVAREGGIAAPDATRMIDDLLDRLSPDIFKEEAKSLPIRKKTLTQVMQVMEVNRQRLQA